MLINSVKKQQSALGYGAPFYDESAHLVGIVQSKKGTTASANMGLATSPF